MQLHNYTFFTGGTETPLFFCVTVGDMGRDEDDSTLPGPVPLQLPGPRTTLEVLPTVSARPIPVVGFRRPPLAATELIVLGGLGALDCETTLSIPSDPRDACAADERRFWT